MYLVRVDRLRQARSTRVWEEMRQQSLTQETRASRDLNPRTRLSSPGSGRGSTTNNHDCRSALIWLAHAAYQTALPSTELNPPGAQKRDNTKVIYRGVVNATMGIMNIDSEGSDPRPLSSFHGANKTAMPSSMNSACSACPA